MKNKTLIVRWLKIFLISGVYGLSLYPYLPVWFHLLGASLVLGFGTYMGVGLVIEAFLNRRDSRLIQASLNGQHGTDGKPWAAIGTIHPLGDPVTTPFSRSECALFSYDIYQQYWTKRTLNGSTHVAEPTSYSGFHMAPCEIRTTTSRVKVLGFPELSDVPETETTTYSEIRSFLDQATFSKPIGGYIPGVNELSKTIPVDGSGAASEDFKFRDPVAEHPLKSREKAIKKGAEVCLLGIFEAKRNAIIPDRRRYGRTMKLIPGPGQEALGKLTQDSFAVIAFGCFIALACIAIGVLPLLPDTKLNQLPYGEKLVSFREKALTFNGYTDLLEKVRGTRKQEEIPSVKKPVEPQPVQPVASGQIEDLESLFYEGNIEGLRQALQNGLDPNYKIPQPNAFTYPLIVAVASNQPEMARLLVDSGANVNGLNSHMFNALDTAVTYQNVEMVRFLLESGAEIYSGDTQRLAPLNRAILNQDVEVVSTLLEFGADPAPPDSDMYIARLPADSDKAQKIRTLVKEARQKR